MKDPAQTPADRALDRLRKLCFGLPAVEEKASHGAPSYFVRGKMFCSFANDAYRDGIAAWVKAEPERQQALVKAAPKTYFVPKYVGVKGWVGVDLEKVDWDDLAILLEEAWTSIAPKSAATAPVLPPPPLVPLPTTDPKVVLAALEKLEALRRERYPDAEVDREKGLATWRVKNKPFMYFFDNHHGDGKVAVLVKVPKEENQAIIDSDPTRYYMPAYVGPKGWLAIRVDTKRVDWKDVATRIATSCAATALAKKPVAKGTAAKR